MRTENLFIRSLIGLGLIALGSIFVTLLFSIVEADTIIVAKDGNGDFDTIQDAIDDATNGDSIRVWGGNYHENVVVDRTVSLVGNGSKTTIIDGGGSGDVMTVTSTQVELSGFSVTGSSIEQKKAGIFVGSNNIMIRDVNCSNNYNGIFLDSSNNSTLMNNICQKSYEGIRLNNSNYCFLSGNNCSNNDWGITVSNSNYCTLTSNLCEDNKFGISLTIYPWLDMVSCDNNVIVNNTCISNEFIGISLHNSNNCTIQENSCIGNFLGIEIYESVFYSITNNDCQLNWGSIEVGYYSHNGTIVNNTCENNTLGNGIKAWLSNGCVIANNSCRSTSYGDGIQLLDSDFSKITDNVCDSSEESGITLINSDHCIVTNNSFTNNDNGMIISSSNNCTLTSISCEYNTIGILLTDSNAIRIERSSIMNNVEGISVMDHSSGNSAHNTTIENNSIFGINATRNNHTFFDATLNWWGNNSGPYHYQNNTGGTKDIVSDFVDFDPWIGKEENTRPVAVILSISPSPATENDIVTFTGAGIDEGSIVRYVWRLEHVEIYNGVDSTFNLSILELGVNTIYFKVQDNAGEWSEEVQTSITILSANMIPIVSILTPTEGDMIAGVFTINGTASDIDGRIIKVYLSIKENAWLTATGTEKWSYQWDTETIENGNHTIRVRSYDGFNYSAEASITITVNNENNDKEENNTTYCWILLIVVIIIVMATYFQMRTGSDNE